MKFSASTLGFYDEDVHSADQIPSDAVSITNEMHAAMLAAQSAGHVIAANANGLPMTKERPAPTTDDILAAMTGVVQAHIDAPAKAWGYDNAGSAVTYVGDPNAQFDAEGKAMRAFRSACWVAAGAMRKAVEAGTRAAPSEAEVLAALPTAPTRPSVT
jgi:hypothetical protein